MRSENSAILGFVRLLITAVGASEIKMLSNIETLRCITRLGALALIAIMLHGCGSQTVEECLADAAKAPTEQGVNVAATACYQKHHREEKATSKSAYSASGTKIRDMCYVYWDGVKWQSGRTEGDAFKRFSRDRYGVELVEIAIPTKMSDTFHIAEKVGEKVKNDEFDQFINQYWYQVEALCGFK
jgi:hypothetical protein